MLYVKQFSNYQSDITQFLEQLKQANPDLEKKQLAGRALLWDKPARSLDEQRRVLDSAVKRETH